MIQIICLAIQVVCLVFQIHIDRKSVRRAKDIEKFLDKIEQDMKDN